jgi:hypothetical protein
MILFMQVILAIGIWALVMMLLLCIIKGGHSQRSSDWKRDQQERIRRHDG